MRTISSNTTRRWPALKPHVKNLCPKAWFRPIYSDEHVNPVDSFTAHFKALRLLAESRRRSDKILMGTAGSASRAGLTGPFRTPSGPPAERCTLAARVHAKSPLAGPKRGAARENRRSPQKLLSLRSGAKINAINRLDLAGVDRRSPRRFPNPAAPRAVRSPSPRDKARI